MEKIIGSKIDFTSFDSFLAIEFKDCVQELLDLKEVQELDNYSQHLHTSRLQNSLNVAYYSYLISKIFHLDYKSAARAGVLHDLFHYNWREVTDEAARAHAFEHPQVALHNAEKIVELNDIERDAISVHMWPLSDSMPKYLESFVVSCADKYCALVEILDATRLSFTKKFFRRKVSVDI